MIPTPTESLLKSSGLDLDQELAQLTSGMSTLMIPQVRIEHRENGQHRLYVDHGESYLESASEEDIPGNTFRAVIFQDEAIRALWRSDDNLPQCSALNNEPMVDEPLSGSCLTCAEGVIGGRCKPKVKLWMLVDTQDGIKPMIMNVSPTGLKHYQAHKRRLSRSRLPLVAVWTTVSLQDVRKNGFRWAEALFNFDEMVDESTLKLVKDARAEYARFMRIITENDFGEPGDKLE